MRLSFPAKARQLHSMMLQIPSAAFSTRPATPDSRRCSTVARSQGTPAPPAALQRTLRAEWLSQAHALPSLQMAKEGEPGIRPAGPAAHNSNLVFRIIAGKCARLLLKKNFSILPWGNRVALTWKALPRLTHRSTHTLFQFLKRPTHSPRKQLWCSEKSCWPPLVQALIPTDHNLSV